MHIQVLFCCDKGFRELIQIDKAVAEYYKPLLEWDVLGSRICCNWIWPVACFLLHTKSTFACSAQAGGVWRELKSLLLKDTLIVEPQRDEGVTISVPWTVVYLCSCLHSCVSLHWGYSQEALSAVIKGSHVGGNQCTWNLGPDGSQLESETSDSLSRVSCRIES